LKKANQEAVDNAPKKVITFEKNQSSANGAESDISSRLKKREHNNVDLETLIRQGKEQKRQSKFDQPGRKGEQGDSDDIFKRVKKVHPNPER
jgi:hypothetical protein